jgi:NADPH2:quinone reductase
MRAVELSGFGGPDVLRIATRPVPVAGAGEVRIRVCASGVNRPDLLQRMGRYPPPPGASDVPGLEVAGVIVDGDPVAMAEAGWQVGDRACALVTGGGYAEYCVAPIGQCLPVPLGLSDVEAASLPEAAFTVWSNVFDRGGLKSGEWLLVHGGSSGIGTAAIQMAVAAGANVIVTAGTPEKCAACTALGAAVAIPYRDVPFEPEVLRHTQGRGVDVVLDMVAGGYTARNLSAMAEDGRLVVIAVQGGVRAEVDMGQLMRKRLTVTGSTLRARSVAFKSAIARRLRSEIWPQYASGAIRPVVHATFAAEAVADAHRVLEAGHHVGKVVLKWDADATHLDGRS